MRRLAITALLLLMLPAMARAEAKFPAPEFRTGYKLPQLVVNHGPWAGWDYVDVAVLAATLAVSAWFIYAKRSRRHVFAVMVFSLIYFGFWRRGCVCPVGSVQNVALAAGGHGYALPWVVAAFFALPLLVSLFYGRVFCASVCPLGAIQDAVLWKPLQVPAWLEHALGVFAYVYLGLAVLFAATNSDFVICRYDPFVGFFRFSATAQMLSLGLVLLLVSMFVGRVYCRFICPYSVLLRLLSKLSKRQVSITPKDCVDCRLCESSCPFGAIRYPSPKDAPARRGAGKGQLVALIALLPVLVGGFALVGYAAKGPLSRLDVTVRLAEQVWWQEAWWEEAGLAVEPTDELKVFADSGQSIDSLYESARAVQHRMAIGGSIFGAWVGLVIGLKLISLVVRRTRTGYTADPAGCVACGRCYASCPVEQERRQVRSACLESRL